MLRLLFVFAAFFFAKVPSRSLSCIPLVSCAWHLSHALALFQQVDPRIHFALNCGARSCPPVKLFTPQGLNGELQAAAAAFVAAEVSVPDETGEVRNANRFYSDPPPFAFSLAWQCVAVRARADTAPLLRQPKE